ncbi:unnamed protein product [Nyctereutes procyonoides]|uniref:(raccoon dog) hypothetical protein n=1 Tax=Nyctereutes procyonoides TaxID=34880 RepID=A0A811ZL03_NYCPR|nr:unnamed protein product [Nyctereutes procyonoides]
MLKVSRVSSEGLISLSITEAPDFKIRDPKIEKLYLPVFYLNAHIYLNALSTLLNSHCGENCFHGYEQLQNATFPVWRNIFIYINRVRNIKRQGGGGGVSGKGEMKQCFLS